MESYCDVRGPKYPWPAVDREMKSSRVGLSSGCHSVVELGDYPRIIVLTRHHEWFKMLSLYEEHGVSEPRVFSKCREIIVHLPMKISIPTANIPQNGVAGEVRSPDDGPRRQVWGSENTLIRWRGWRSGSQCRRLPYQVRALLADGALWVGLGCEGSGGVSPTQV